MLETAASWPVPAVLAAAAALLVVESGTLVGMALPGTTLLVAVGLWAHGAPAALVPAVLVTATATVTGAHLGYHATRHRTPDPASRGLDVSVSRSAGLRRGSLVAARTWLVGRGPLATVALVAAGHWAAAARPLLPRLAGAAGVRYALVGPALVVSGAAWAATLVLLGNTAGALVLDHAGWAPVVLVAVLVAGLLVRGRRRDGRRLIDVSPLHHRGASASSA